MNRLAHNLCYLVGPIDEAKDRGTEWRKDISEFLWSLSIGVLNPCDKPTNHNEDKEFIRKLNEYKSNGNYDKVTELVKEIIQIDLHMVDLSNFIICYIDKDIHSCGSYSELTYATLEHKPCLIYCKQGVSNIPGWLFGLCDHNMFFDNWEDLKAYIEDVAYSTKYIEGWKFLDYNKIFNIKK